MNNQLSQQFNTIFSEPIGNLSAKCEYETMKARANKSFILLQGLRNATKEQAGTKKASS